MTKLSVKIAIAAGALLPTFVSAQGLTEAQNQLREVGTVSGIPNQPLPVLIGRIINVLLGVLGIIFVVLIVYAGFLYMTAAGEDDKVGKAKKLLTQAIIGLIIIVAAYSIANFIINQLVTVSAP